MSSETATCFSNALPKTVDVCPATPVFPSVHPFSQDSRVSTSAVNIFQVTRSDEDLLVELSGGSKEALSVLFQRHARIVFNVARRILRDESEAEDLVQDLFLYLFQKASVFNPEKGTGSSWIIQMAYHRAIDRRRYLNARGHYDRKDIEEERQPATCGTVSIDEVAGRALLEKLRRELSPEQRETLELHFFEGYTFHEIADRTGQTFGNVRHHYYRGLEKLRSYVFPERRT